jgi:predicted neuraminidase
MIVREHVVFDGHEGWRRSGVTFRLACGPVIQQAANGDLVCAWLTGSDNEPATDNCVALARSSDRGRSWSEPEILVPAGVMAGAVTVISRKDDGVLVAFGAFWPSHKDYTEWHWFRTESTDHGRSWSDRTPFTIRPGKNAAVLTGIRLASGAFVLPCQFFERRAVALTGPAEKIAFASSEAEAATIPPAETADAAGARRRPGKFHTHLHGCSVLVSEDPSLTRWRERGRVDNRPLGLLEPTIVELRDGRLAMLMRAEFGGYLWRADSEDGGFTWSKARQTDIADPTSLAHLLRLPDGRIALLHNAAGGRIGFRDRRDPLSLWISDDEMESWSVRHDAIRGGQLAYPNGLITNDGRLVFVYDRDRREVRFVEVDL